MSEASNKSETLEELARDTPNLITLDLQLGADNGLDVAQMIRRVSDVPIVMVTGKGDVIDRVVGLEIGADDYISKPFHVREVTARIKSILRRSQMAKGNTVVAAHSQTITFDGLSATLDQFSLIGRDGVPIELTSGEFKLLMVFLDRPKRTLSRDQLMELAGGHNYTPLDRTVDNQIVRLRKKIERDPAHPTLIKTVRGIGYVLAADVMR